MDTRSGLVLKWLALLRVRSWAFIYISILISNIAYLDSCKSREQASFYQSFLVLIQPSQMKRSCGPFGLSALQYPTSSYRNRIYLCCSRVLAIYQRCETLGPRNRIFRIRCKALTRWCHGAGHWHLQCPWSVDQQRRCQLDMTRYQIAVNNLRVCNQCRARRNSLKSEQESYFLWKLAVSAGSLLIWTHEDFALTFARCKCISQWSISALSWRREIVMYLRTKIDERVSESVSFVRWSEIFGSSYILKSKRCQFIY